MCDHHIHKSAEKAQKFHTQKKHFQCISFEHFIWAVLEGVILQNWAGSYDKDAEACDRNLNLQPERFSSEQDPKTKMCFDYHQWPSGKKL